MENEECIILWDFTIPTDRVIFSPATCSMTRNSNSLKIIPKFGRVDAVRFARQYCDAGKFGYLLQSLSKSPQ